MTYDVEAPPPPSAETPKGRTRIVSDLLGAYDTAVLSAQEEYHRRSREFSREFTEKTNAVIEGRFLVAEDGQRYLPTAAQEAYLEVLEREGDVCLERDGRARAEYEARSRAAREEFRRGMQDRLGVRVGFTQTPPRPRYPLC